MATATSGTIVISKGELTWKEKASDYFVNEGPKLVFMILWAVGTLSLFIWKYWVYWKGPKAIVFEVLNHGVTFSRASAAAISFNSALMLVTVLRNFLSWLRGTFLGNFIPVDKNIVFHRYIGWTILFFTVLHVGGHFFNYNTFNQAPLDKLALIGLEANPSPAALAYMTLPGSTGYIVSLIMVLMYTAAMKSLRGPYYNLFWYSHHLFILYFILLCAHGASAILEPASFWYYTIGPMILYAIERTVRLIRGSQNTILLLAIAHPSKVIELQLKKSTFKYKPGQYLFLNCPYIAGQEWHPFTISSAPEEEFVSIHIRIVGDWTTDLWNFLNPEKKLGVVQENLLTAPDGSPIFKIDGPFGAASEDVFKFRTLMLCAGGIGVTPFASILKSVMYKIQTTANPVLQKVYFYWISRDKNAFEWFNEILAAIELENVNNFLEIHIYLTGQLNPDEIREVMYGMDNGSDQITGLQSPTHFGRPDWNSIFADMSRRHNAEQVGVFFCGPPVLSKTLYNACRTFTNVKTGTKFIYHKENF